ncbi:MAG: flavin reductase family protein [Chitinivibrionales bacterium]|nr:flavin reductase family protein [Chitinivibrionales bacterium]
MKQENCLEVIPEALGQITGKGAFLTVADGDRLNTMTIGWATIGYVWKRNIMTAAVRLSRHTFSLIENSDNFSVSVPTVDMAKELAFCGSKSGSDYDKFKECNLEIVDPQKITTPIIKMPGLHFECTIVYKSAMDPSFMTPDFEAIYPKKDYHTLYYGEIVDCYRI